MDTNEKDCQILLEKSIKLKLNRELCARGLISHGTCEEAERALQNVVRTPMSGLTRGFVYDIINEKSPPSDGGKRSVE